MKKPTGPTLSGQRNSAHSTPKQLTDVHVAIVGLGLMGGSLAGALRGKCKLVVGVARREETIETARELGLIDRGTTDVSEGVRDADVVVLAIPVRAIMHMLDEIGSLVGDGCLVLDLGSTKTQVVAKMATLPDHVDPLGAHPMCGKELSGISAADPELYQGCTFVFTPLQRTSTAALTLGDKLVEAVGGRTLVLEAERHDRLVAAISHLPYLLACALVGTAENVASVDPALWEVAASGFRDTSRLAASDVTMMLDIIITNQEMVLEALRTFEEQLREIICVLESGDNIDLRTTLTAIRERRKEVFP